MSRTLKIAFQYETESGLYDLEAQVENDAKDSYTCVNIVGAEEVRDDVWQAMAELACEKAWEQDNQPRNWRGCECIGRDEGMLRRAEHERDCPLRLCPDERARYLDIAADEQVERAVRAYENKRREK